MKISSRIFQIGCAGLTTPEDEAVIVETGCGSAEKQLFRNIHKYVVDSGQKKLLVVTHGYFNRIRGILGIRDCTNCKALALELYLRYMERGDDRVTTAV
jgi:hypothetical protein